MLSKTPLSKIAPELMLHIRHSCYTFYIRNQFQNGCQSAILSTVMLENTNEWDAYTFHTSVYIICMRRSASLTCFSCLICSMYIFSKNLCNTYTHLYIHICIATWRSCDMYGSESDGHASSVFLPSTKKCKMRLRKFPL